MKNLMHDKDFFTSRLTKREFLKLCGNSFCVFSLMEFFGFPKSSQGQIAKRGLIKTKLSPYFISLKGGEIQCELCPHQCRVSKGKRGLCLWIKKGLGSETPVHFSRFYPLYKLRSLPPTPVSTLEKARALALSSGLEYVYIGNVPGHEGENTFCPRCKKLLIQRTGYMVGEVHLKSGKCGYCGKPIPGIWT